MNEILGEAMNVNEMEAGRELDALVAQHVMGCKVLGSELTGFFCGCSPETHRDKDGFLPRFSTDIAAAWEIVEKVKATSSRGYVLDFLRGEWTVGLRACGDAGEPELYDHCAGCAEEAPLAICKAALKAAL